MVLKGCPYVAVSLCRLHTSNFFGGRAGFDVDASHVLPKGMLAAITLVGCMAYDGETRACTEYEVPPYQRHSLLTSCWSGSPEGCVHLCLFPLRAGFSFSPH